MPKPEAGLQSKIQTAYRKRGAWIVKIHGGPMQPKAIDLIACYRGVFIGIETKAKYGEGPTVRQRETLREIDAADGWTCVAHDVAEALEVLDAVDTRL